MFKALLQREVSMGKAALLLLLMLLATLLFGARIFAYPGVFPLDDAYITLANALAIQGQASGFIDASPFEGATSAVHLILVWFSLLLTGEKLALSVVAVLGALAYMSGIWNLARMHGFNRNLSLLFVLFGLFLGLGSWHLHNGLETGLAMAGVIWALCFAASADEKKQWLWLPLLLGQLPFIRPELIALGPLLLAAIWLKRWYSNLISLQALRSGVYLLMVFLVSASIWLVINWLATGNVIPTTISAKKYFFANGCQSLQLKAPQFAGALLAFHVSLGGMILAYRSAFKNLITAACLVFIVVFYSAYAVSFPEALLHNVLRYQHLLLPIILYFFMIYLQPLQQGRDSWKKWLLVACLVQLTAVNLPFSYSNAGKNRAFTANELSGVAQWMNDNVPQTAITLIHDAGYINYATQSPLVDIVGLKTAENVAVHKAYTWQSCGAQRSEAYAAIAAKYQPEFLVASNGWDAHFQVSEGLRQAGWAVTRVKEASNEIDYHVYRLLPPAVDGVDGH